MFFRRHSGLALIRDQAMSAQPTPTSQASPSSAFTIATANASPIPFALLKEAAYRAEEKLQPAYRKGLLSTPSLKTGSPEALRMMETIRHVRWLSTMPSYSSTDCPKERGIQPDNPTLGALQGWLVSQEELCDQLEAGKDFGARHSVIWEMQKGLEKMGNFFGWV